jgi:predicted P-loop ATPase/GTPase
MKHLVLALVLITMLASCSKDKTGLPAGTQTAVVKPSVSTPVVTQAAAIQLDTVKYAVNFLLQGQTVKTAISNDTLKLTYAENVKLLLNPADYHGSWALHLSPDFSKATVAKFDYTTVTKENNTTLNWIDDNLNNIITKIVSDTVVNNVKMVNVKVYSQFNFTKKYSSHAAAVNEQNSLLQTTTDVMVFSSYYLMPTGRTSAYTGTDKITYTK